MFLASIVSALKLEEMRHLHSHWTSLITNCMPFLDHSLTSTVLEVTGQLALNLGIVFSRKIYKSETILSSKVRPETEVDKYLIFQ